MKMLAERVALDWVGEREWKKGQPYVRGLTGLTVRPAAGGKEYRAFAHGQEKYRVSVTVGGGKVVASACSCPVGGYCKHVAALLARLTQGNAGFAALPALDDTLDALDAPELRRLVRRLLDKAPELEPLVYARASQQSGDLTARIQAAFELLPSGYEQEEWGYSEEDLDTTELDEVLDELDERRMTIGDFDAEETESVVRAYIAVLDGVEEFYSGDIDYGLDDVQAEAVAGLYDLFINAELDGDLREDALEAVRTELVSGRLDFDDEFVNWYSVLRANEQQQIRDMLQKLAQQGESYRKRRYLEGLLLLRGGERTDADEEALLRAGYDQNKLALFLIERGRVDEAVHSLETVRGPIAFAELREPFVQAGALARLESLALKAQGWSAQEARLWLYDLYLDTGRREQAHALARQEAATSRTTEWFSRLKQTAPDWPTERTRLIAALRKRPDTLNVLLELLIGEGLSEEAFVLTADAGRRVSSMLALRVAALPGLSDERAALLTVQTAQHLAAGRSRPAYAQAAAALKPLLGRLGQAETRRLVAGAFPEVQRLPALRDELQKAGLL